MSFTVASGASFLPAVAGTFRVIIDSEIIRIASVSGNVFTVAQRGAEGSTAQGHSANVAVVASLTAGGILAGMADAVEDAGGVSLPLDATDSGDIINLQTFPLTATNPSEITGLHPVATSGSYNDLENVPSYATVATSGVYDDLTGKPTIPNVPDVPGTANNYYLNADGSGGGVWNSLSVVGSTNDYNDISNKPFIPINLSDLNDDILSTVAGSGDYNDLINKPDQSLNVADAPTFAALHVSTIYDHTDSIGSDGQYLKSDGASVVWDSAPNPFNQELNDDDDVEFNSVVAASAVNITAGGGAGWNINADGSMYVGGSWGAAGDVLTTGGIGNTCTWTTLPTIPSTTNLLVGDGTGQVGDSGYAVPDQLLNTTNSPTFVMVTTPTINSQNYPTAAGVDGQVLTTNGVDAVWADAANPFNQTLNTDDSPTFDNLTISTGMTVGTNFTVGDVPYISSMAGSGGKVIYSDGAGLSFVDHNPFDQELNTDDVIQCVGINVTAGGGIGWNINADGSLYVDGAYGTAGQVLTSSGEGVTCYWSDAGIDSSPDVPNPAYPNAGYGVLGFDGASTYTWAMTTDVPLSAFNNDLINQSLNTSDSVVFNAVSSGTVDADTITVGGITATGDLTCNSFAVFGGFPPPFVPTYNQLVDSTGGSSSGTFELVDVGSTFDQAAINDNFATLQDRIEELQNILISYGLAAVSP